LLYCNVDYVKLIHNIEVKLGKLLPESKECSFLFRVLARFSLESVIHVTLWNRYMGVT
jgi:hypothetical protein